MKILLVTALAVAALGCSKKAEDTPQMKCDAAVKRDVDTSMARRRSTGPMASNPAMQKMLDEATPLLKATLAALCTTDAWSEDVVTCFSSSSDLSKCKDGLTREQRARYTQETMKVMTEARMKLGAEGMGRVAPRPPRGAAAVGSDGSATPK